MDTMITIFSFIAQSIIILLLFIFLLYFLFGIFSIKKGESTGWGEESEGFLIIGVFCYYLLSIWHKELLGSTAIAISSIFFISLFVFIKIEIYEDKEWYNEKFHYFFFSFYIIIGSLFIMFGLLGDALIVFLKNLEINYLHLDYEDPIFIVLSSNYVRAQLFVSGLLSLVTGYGLYKKKKYALYLLLISLALISARNIVFIFTLQQGILERILLLLVPVFSILIAKYYLNRKNILFK